jgi:CheY-like chemotaxis protein
MTPLVPGARRPPQSDPALRKPESSEAERASREQWFRMRTADFEEGDPDQLRLLVVDDYPDAADSLALLLKMWGHNVHVCRTGDEALDVVSAYRPDVALIDIMLPGMDGYQLARRMQKQPDSHRMTLIAVTGLGDNASRRCALEAGFSHHFLKPLTYTTLQQILVGISTRKKNLSHR